MTDLQNRPTAERHWTLVVVIVCLAQFMVVLDATIVLVAVPSIQKDLHFAPADLQWVINAYLLTFGGLLMLGGRLGDLLGRRRLFLIGIAVFTLASLADALSGSPAMLVAARAVQGIGAALVSPAALSIITTSVPVQERAKALGAFAGISGGGGAAGLLLGGVLTDSLSWEWVFLINLPVGVAALALALRFVPESRSGDRTEGFDFGGATLVTAGLGLLTFALVKAQDFGWGDTRTLGLLAGSLGLLVAFGLLEQRRAAPLVRLSIFRTRTIAAANGATVLLVGGMYSLFFFGTLYFQDIKGWDALQSGAGFLPQALGIIGGSVLSQRLIARFGPKRVLVAGLVVGAAGLVWMTTLTPGGSYAGGFLPGLLLLAIGTGTAFVPLTLIATTGVEHHDQGLASGLFNTSQQIGGALGLAILGTVASAATKHAGGSHADALVHGYTTAFAAGAALLALGAAFTLVVLRGHDGGHTEPAIGTAAEAVPA